MTALKTVRETEEPTAIASSETPRITSKRVTVNDAPPRKKSIRDLDALEQHEFVARLDNMEQQELWTIYHEWPSTRLRNYLVERYASLVRYNASRIHTRLPDEVDIEDLVSVGTFGLMDAIGAFDLERGVKFETFCAPRIRGAILDHLRSMDWVPRLVRHRTSQVERVKAQLQMSLGRKPTDEEISSRLGIDEEEVKKVMRDGSAVQMTSLSRRRFQSDGNREVREIDVLSDRTQVDPLTLVQKTDLKSILTKGLSRAERLIVVLYYYEDMTMKEIGATLDLSESRVSQMHSSILARLKAHMQNRERDFEDAVEV